MNTLTKRGTLDGVAGTFSTTQIGNVIETCFFADGGESRVIGRTRVSLLDAQADHLAGANTGY